VLVEMDLLHEIGRIVAHALMCFDR
jgi:hypothetical protein